MKVGNYVYEVSLVPDQVSLVSEVPLVSEVS